MEPELSVYRLRSGTGVQWGRRKRLQPDQGVVRLPASQPRWFRAFEFVLSQGHVEGAAEGGEGAQVLGTCECLVGLR